METEKKTAFKEQQTELATLINDLNNLSVKTYKYLYKYGELHKILVSDGYVWKNFIYAKRIDDLIFNVKLLIKYRVTEYESEF